MKVYVLLVASLMVFLYGCTQAPDCNKLLIQIENDIISGNLNDAKLLADYLKLRCPGDSRVVRRADSLEQIAERIALDFSLTEVQIISRLNNSTASFSTEEKASWENRNWLEYRIINGEKRYFNRAVSNLGLIKSFYQNRSERDSLIANDPKILFRKMHTGSIIKSSDNLTQPVVPVEMSIEYSITVHPGAVPEGAVVRCWIPWPKESHLRQQKVTLISASQKKYIIAPDSAVHRTIYMEAKTEKEVPLVFRVSYRYQSYGQYFDMKNLRIKSYDKTSLLYKKYTSEQLPQICFTDKIKQLIDSITGSEENPAEIVRKIYYWFSKNILWASAMEYSIMPDIPGYVLKYRRGDCGMQTFLFMSMLRYKGIPVKWQSGWMMPPDSETPHDWCEVYFEGAGWIPVDVYCGLQYSDNLKTKEFYISGIDSYRLIVNDGISGTLYPTKNFLRSDPFDFQRGEVEWNGGNLYFDKWDYHMKIEYKGK